MSAGPALHCSAMRASLVVIATFGLGCAPLPAGELRFEVFDRPLPEALQGPQSVAWADDDRSVREVRCGILGLAEPVFQVTGRDDSLLGGFAFALRISDYAAGGIYERGVLDQDSAIQWDDNGTITELHSAVAGLCRFDIAEDSRSGRFGCGGLGAVTDGERDGLGSIVGEFECAVVDRAILRTNAGLRGRVRQ